MDDVTTTDTRLDEALEETFPASDTPAVTIDQAARVGPVPEEAHIIDNDSASRFEITIEGSTAYLAYERTSDAMTLVHTEVADALRGRHLGDQLVQAALADARRRGLRVVIVCPFA